MIASWLMMALAVLVVPTGRRASARSTSAPGTDRSRGETGRLLPVAIGVLGLACVVVLGPVRGLVAAGVACPAALVGLRALLRREGARALRIGPDPAVPLVLDLSAAALRAGQPPAAALDAAAPAAPAPVAAAFAQVAGLLRLGAEPGRAWQVLSDGALAPVATVAIRSSSSGARLAVAFERLAGELRSESQAQAAARAQRVGVLAMAPLGLCFLPAFVALGVVPVVVGMARTVLGGLP